MSKSLGYKQRVWFIPVLFVGSEKREAKIEVLERCQKSVLVIVGGGVARGWLADTCGSYRGLDLRCAANW